MRISDWSSDVCLSDLYGPLFDVEQRHILLSRVHVAFDHAAQRRGARIGNLDHRQNVDRDALHHRRVGAIEARETVRRKRGIVVMAGEIARPVEEYVEGDPEGARILRADFVTDVAELNHGPPPCALRWAGAPDRYIRSGPARTGRRARRYDSADRES